MRNIEVTVGRTGVLTPTAVFDPIFLAGTSVSRASLHNGDIIANLGVGIGDTIKVRKAGDIIRRSSAYRRLPGSKPLPCPRPARAAAHPWCICRTKQPCAASTPNARRRACANLIHFASRNAMAIDGLGEAVAVQLIDKGLVSTGS